MSSDKVCKKARLNWDETFMNIANVMAKRTSCKFHEASIVFVDKNNRIISLGYNGPTEGDIHCIDVGCAKVDGDPMTNKLKRCRGAHAEINGIINTQDTTRLRGATAYTLLFPCYDCMKAMNNTGEKEIVYVEEYKRISNGGENMVAENEAWELAQRSGIQIRKFTGKLADFSMFDLYETTEQNIGTNQSANRNMDQNEPVYL